MLPGWFVVIMGLSIVFIGLISIILLCKLLALVCKRIGGDQKVQESKNTISDNNEIVAAITAAIAEEVGTEISCIKILSIKRI